MRSRAWCGALLALLASYLPQPLLADEYHAINGFFGERSAGLGGAFTAVSDDPSGNFYNPAGIAFGSSTYFSLSASNYRLTEKTYVNVFGPGQGYTRRSESYLPNFVGAIRSVGDYRLGVSIVNPNTERFDQADQVVNPLSLSTTSGFTNEFTEDASIVMGGPTVARAISDRLSWGLSLFYFSDTRRVTTTQLAEATDGSYRQVSILDRRRTKGFVPVLGLMFMPNDRLSVGASLRQTLVVSANRRQSGITSTSSSRSIRGVQTTLNTEDGGAQVLGSSIIVGPGTTGAIPETHELRLGAAYFFSRYLMFAVDFIRTGGFSLKQDRTAVDVSNRNLYLADPKIPELDRRPVNNMAAGFEYYVTDNFAVSGGMYTNRANSRKIRWAESALAAAARSTTTSNFTAGNLFLTTVAGTILYQVPEFAAPERFEHVNLLGNTLGISWSDATSSISITLVYERGTGAAIIDSSQAAQQLKYRGRSVYVVASTRN